MKRTALALGLAAIASSSFAYNAQLNGGFSNFTHDDNYTDQDAQIDLQGKYFLEPVQIKNHPFNEAAFLEHNSNLYATYAYRSIESKDYIYTTFDPLAPGMLYQFGLAKDQRDIHHFAGGLEYFHEQFYLNGEIGIGRVKAKSDIDFNYGTVNYKNDYNVTTYRALVGFMPISNLLVAAGVDGYQGDKYHDDETDFAAKVKYVTPFGQNGHVLNFEADGTFGDENNIIFGADYYLNQAFSVGTAYSLKDDNQSDNNFLWFRSKYFMSENLALGAEAGFSSGMDLFNINATYRF